MDLTKFVLEASEAESMARSLGLSTVLQLLPTLIESGKNHAKPPISNFHVSAVGLGSDGRVFLGVNLEFLNLPLHNTVHAEQFLLLNLAFHHCPALVAFAVSAAPCGHCRQFLQELRNSSTLQIHITSLQQHNNPDDGVKFKPLAELLPYPFGPSDLLDDHTALLLEPHNNGLSLSTRETISENDDNDNDKQYVCNGSSDNHSKNQNNNGFWRETEKENTLLKLAALEAANESHAPYSECPSGVALMDCDGNLYKGSYVESAAYNPSLGPVQAALVAFVAKGGGNYERIVAAALVEKERAKVRQEDTARLLLKMVSPKCDFKEFHCSVAEN